MLEKFFEVFGLVTQAVAMVCCAIVMLAISAPFLGSYWLCYACGLVGKNG